MPCFTNSQPRQPSRSLSAWLRGWCVLGMALLLVLGQGARLQLRRDWGSLLALTGRLPEDKHLARRYRLPEPRLALGAALGVGLAVSFIASQVRPVFTDVQQLRTKTGLPLLGVVSMILSDDDKRRERANRLRFYLGTGSLLASYLAAMVTVSIIAARQVG